MDKLYLLLLIASGALFVVFSTAEKIARRKNRQDGSGKRFGTVRTVCSILSAVCAAGVFCVLIIAGVKPGIIAAALMALLLFSLV